MGEIGEYEMDLLRHLGGEDVPGLMWGAAMSEAVEHLHGGGYLMQVPSANGIEYRLTASGQNAVAVHRARSTP